MIELSSKQWQAIFAYQAKEMESLVGDSDFARRASLTSHYSRIGEWLEPGSGGRVLELGCGPGRYVAMLASLGFDVVGVDPVAYDTWSMIRSHRDVTFQDGVFAEVLPFANASFDHIACMGALLYFRDPVAALAEMRRVVKPNGRLVVRSVNRNSLYQRVRGAPLDPASHNHYTMPELQDLLGTAQFRVHKAESYGFFPPYMESYWWWLTNGIVPIEAQSMLSAVTPPTMRMALTVFCTAL
jgi:ubiquinone/menaquinone biosynthesis C-methylase UbiE